MNTELSNNIPQVIIDTDPGVDDFFALIWAGILHRGGKLNIKAITTVGGNVNAKATYLNACRVLQMMQLEGIQLGKVEQAVSGEDASHIHGSDGIGGLSSLLPQVKEFDAKDSVDLLIEELTKNPGMIDILAVGPLTNLANAEKKKPGVLKLAKRIIAMGGAFEAPGNVSPVAEFNVRFDPESAKIVTESGCNLFFVPLDVTTQALFDIADLDPVLEHVNNPNDRVFLKKLTEFTIGTNMGFRETHYKRGFFVHDSSTIGFLLYPHLYRGMFGKVMVETKGEFTKGKTLVDMRNFPKTETNAYIVTDIDYEGFLEAMTEDFKKFDFDSK